MNVGHNTEMTCPACKFSGGFKRARPRFWGFDFWHWLVERNYARRTLVCPECGTLVTSASGRWVPYIVVLFSIAIAVIGAVAVGMFSI